MNIFHAYSAFCMGEDSICMPERIKIKNIKTYIE